MKAKVVSDFYYWNPVQITRVELQKTLLLVCCEIFHYSFYSTGDFIENIVSTQDNIFPKQVKENVSYTKYSLGFREPYNKKGYCHFMDDMGYWREAKIEKEMIQQCVGKIVPIPLKNNDARVSNPLAQYVKHWINQLDINDRVYIVINQNKYNAKIFDIRDDKFILLVDKFGVWEKIAISKDSKYLKPYCIPYRNYKEDHYVFNSRYFVNIGKKTDSEKEVILTIDKTTGVHYLEFV